MQRILITATMQSHICQFHLPFIKALKEQGYIVDAAAHNNLNVKPGLQLDCADHVYDIRFKRSPFSRKNFTAYRQMKEVLKNNRYTCIHCNTPMGGVVTRLAAKKYRKFGTKVVYTAHGFHFFHGASIKNWLFYYPIEWFLSFKTDLLICINTEDYEFAKRHLHAKKTVYVNGVGFDSARCLRTQSKAKVRKKLNIPQDSKVMFSIGELNKRKNYEVIIEALTKLRNENIIWYIAGNGPLDKHLMRLMCDKGLEDHMKFIGYTREIEDYFDAADIFVFPSRQEGLPIALMEAMSYGLPIVASDIRGTRDLVKDGKGGYLLGIADSDGFAQKIKKVLHDEELCQRMITVNKQKIKDFELKPVIERMKKIYSNLLEK